MPLVVSFWLRQAFVLLDAFYAGQLTGLEDASQAAIGLTAPFDFLMIAFWVGTSNALTSRMGAAMGAGQGERIEQLKRATSRIIAFLVVLFLLIAVAIWFFAERTALAPDTARQFKIYATVLLAGSAFTSFWSILPDSIVKAHHDTRTTMWAGLLSGGTNAVFNTVFVFVFHWGIFGIALSTVIGRLAGLVYAQARANAHERRRLAAASDNTPGTFERPLLVLLTLAVPSAITFVLMALETFAVNQILLGQPDSTPLLAAWSVFDRIMRFLAMPLIAVGVATLPLVARLWGRQDHSGIRRELRTAMLASLGYVLVVVLPAALFLGPPIARQWTGSEVTLQLAVQTLPFVPAAVLAMAPLFVLRSAFEGMQRPRPGLFFAVVRSLVLVVPLVWLAARFGEDFGMSTVQAVCAAYLVGVGIASAGMHSWMFRDLKRASLASRTV